MHVRVNTATGASDIDGAIRFVEETVLPEVREHKGFAGLTVSGNRSTGDLSVLTIWETEADRDASEGLSEKVRTEAVEKFGGQMRVERYEQALFETGDVPPGPGAKLHIREVRMNPADVDENLAFFRESVVPDMKSTPGFLGVRQLIDRKTGEGRVGSVWADEASLTAQLEKSEQRRAAAATERRVEFGDDSIADVLFIAR